MLYFSIAFLLIVVFIIYRPGKFSEGGVALVGLFSLLLVSVLNWTDIPEAIFGNDFFQPLQVVMILITLAILSTTLDDYGFFKYAAHKAILWSRNNGKTLFRNFFILTLILTSLTSNDVDVLTVTPIILWFALVTKINPIPYLFSVFVVANTSSMEFLIGNLTNIVIGSVFDIGFVEFFLFMVLPTIVTLFGQYWLMKLIFRKQLPDKILNNKELEKVNKKIQQPLPNKRKNIFVLSVLGSVVLGSVLSDFFPIELWMVTTLGALVVLFSNEFNIKERLRVVPWNVVLFVLVFIVLTNKLQSLGIIDVVADFINPNLNSVSGTVLFSSFFGAITSGIINNIPASISLSTTFFTMTEGLSLVTQRAVAYGLVVGTNLGALFTPVGALATILWLTLIRRKGFEFPMKKFIGYGLLVGIFSVAVSSLVISLELIFF